MGSYKEGCLDAKRKREGIVDQKERSGAKKKKIDKPWAVYTYITWSFWRVDNNQKRVYQAGRWATEDQAIRYAEKKRREPYGMSKPDMFWVVNVTRNKDAE